MQYQIIVVNISYGNEFRSYKGVRPESVILDLPKDISKMANEKDQQKFYDCVETFAYNTVTNSFGAFVSHCQVYLPME